MAPMHRIIKKIFILNKKHKCWLCTGNIPQKVEPHIYTFRQGFSSKNKVNTLSAKISKLDYSLLNCKNSKII